MSAETLRRAAALMRERAEAATPGPWWSGGSWFERANGVDGRIEHIPHPTVGHGGTGADLIAKTVRKDRADAEHIASWHPAVALAVADWLDAAYAEWLHYEHSLSAASVRAMSGGTNDPDPSALAVARAYLGGDA